MTGSTIFRYWVANDRAAPAGASKRVVLAAVGQIAVEASSAGRVVVVRASVVVDADTDVDDETEVEVDAVVVVAGEDCFALLLQAVASPATSANATAVLVRAVLVMPRSFHRFGAPVQGRSALGDRSFADGRLAPGPGPPPLRSRTFGPGRRLPGAPCWRQEVSTLELPGELIRKERAAIVDPNLDARTSAIMTRRVERSPGKPPVAASTDCPTVV